MSSALRSIKECEEFGARNLFAQLLSTSTGGTSATVLISNELIGVGDLIGSRLKSNLQGRRTDLETSRIHDEVVW